MASNFDHNQMNDQFRKIWNMKKPNFEMSKDDKKIFNALKSEIRQYVKPNLLNRAMPYLTPYEGLGPKYYYVNLKSKVKLILLTNPFYYVRSRAESAVGNPSGRQLYFDAIFDDDDNRKEEIMKFFKNELEKDVEDSFFYKCLAQVKGKPVGEPEVEPEHELEGKPVVEVEPEGKFVIEGKLVPEGKIVLEGNPVLKGKFVLEGELVPKVSGGKMKKRTKKSNRKLRNARKSQRKQKRRKSQRKQRKQRKTRKN